MTWKNKLRNKSRRKELFMAYGQILLGCIIGGAAYPMFLVPNNIAPGGLTGVATVLNYLVQVPVGLTSMLMNVPLFIIGFKAMGRVFVLRSLVATVLFSMAIDMIRVPPVTMDPLLGTLYGGVLLGIGLGLILRAGATTGGTDMVARMVHKRVPFLSVGMFLFLIDCAVVILAGLCVGLNEGLYAMIAIFVSSKLIDMVMAGLSQTKACFIITSALESVTQRVMTELDRGVTHLEAKGAYSGQNRPMILCVLSSQEVARLKDIVREEDEQAFMFVTGAHEALGEGFSKLGGDT